MNIRWQWSSNWLGLLSATGIMCVVIGAIVALIAQSQGFDPITLWHDSYLRYITRFTFYQAFLSTLLSMLPAIPIAYALSRRQFWGRATLLRLFSMTLVLPVLVAVFGLLSIYGNAGLLAHVFEYFGHKLPFSIYGLTGILLAHVFLNLPFATRLLLQSLETIPFEQHKLAAHLGFTGWQKFKLIAWPRLREQLPHVAGLVFMLCFTSFAVIMTLGGGPKATTIELAIYQALRYDYQLSYGAVLAIWQMLLCGGLVLITQRLAKPIATQTNSHHQELPFVRDSRWQKLWDWGWIAFIILLVLPPLISVVVSGLNSQLPHLLMQASLWLAVKHSLTIALLACLLSVILGITIVLTSRTWRLKRHRLAADGIELIGTVILITPAVVLSTGIFLLLRRYTDVFSTAFWVVIVVNALIALPYVIKTLSQPMLHLAQQWNPLCDSLGMRGLQRFRLLEWRALRAPIAQSLAISFVLSMGDLSAIALFGSQNFQTLPLYLFQLLGSYQMSAAAVASLLLLALSLGLFTAIEKLLIRKPKC